MRKGGLGPGAKGKKSPETESPLPMHSPVVRVGGGVAHSQGRAQGRAPGSQQEARPPSAEIGASLLPRGGQESQREPKYPGSIRGGRQNSVEERKSEENKTSPREPGGRRVHWVILNRSQFSSLFFFFFFFSHWKTETGRWLTLHRKSPQHLSGQRMLHTEILTHPSPRWPRLLLPPVLCGEGDEGWRSDRPKGLLCDPGSLTLGIHTWPPALSLGHHRTLGLFAHIPPC